MKVFLNVYKDRNNIKTLVVLEVEEAKFRMISELGDADMCIELKSSSNSRYLVPVYTHEGVKALMNELYTCDTADWHERQALPVI